MGNQVGLSFGSPVTDPRTGKTTLSNKMLDMDPTAMLDATLEVKAAQLKKAPQKALDTSIQQKSDLLDLQQKIKTYNGALLSLRGIGEGLNQGGVFAKPAVSATSDTAVQPESLIAFDPADGLIDQSFTLRVDRLARQDLCLAPTSIGDQHGALNWSGTLTLGTTTSLGSPKEHDIPITPDMSLHRVVALINTYTNDTGIKASVICIRDGEYRLQLQSIDVGSKITITHDMVDGDNDPVAGPLPVPSPYTADDLRSQITFNGQTIYRPSNHISDVMAPFGVLELKQADPGTTMTITTSANKMGVRDAVETWMSAHNDLQTFINTQKGLVGDDAPKGSLYNTEVLKEAQDILTIFAKSDGQHGVSSLRAAGIVRSDTGMYGFDDSVSDETHMTPFETALKTKFSGIERFFSFAWHTTDPRFDPITHPNQMPNALNGQNITVTLDRGADGTLTATLTGGGVTHQQIIDGSEDSTIVNGPAGSIFQGISIFVTDLNQLAPGSSRAATVTGSQGVADEAERRIKMFLAADGQYDPVMGRTVGEGVFERALRQANDAKTDATDKLAQVDEKMAHKREMGQKRLEAAQKAYGKLQQISGLLEQLENANRT